ncbi:MAG: hypothetical protein GX542_08265 [Rhodococcus sp.]|nr:hypothetical protein [Rhodococcus sp. (in: high G+C Gram-positive bacteria)]
MSGDGEFSDDGLSVLVVEGDGAVAGGFREGGFGGVSYAAECGLVDVTDLAVGADRGDQVGKVGIGFDPSPEPKDWPRAFTPESTSMDSGAWAARAPRAVGASQYSGSVGKVTYSR